MEGQTNSNSRCSNYVSEEDVKLIVKKSGFTDEDVSIDNYTIDHASTKMLGFLADYWKLIVYLSLGSDEKKVLHFFIKAIPKTNVAKANMVKEMNSFKKETFFYSVLKERMEVCGLSPWSAKFITSLDEAIVFEDLNAAQYRIRNKFQRFDTPHTLRALETLARFHASSIILENRKSKVLGRPYIIHDEFEQFLDVGAYKVNDIWFNQCMIGALEAVKEFSKYASEKNLKQIERTWNDIWESALNLREVSAKYQNVICHSDLWNNNILFHYENVGEYFLPDHCVLVDFQAVRCQPPTGDVMLLLYCNLDPKFREENVQMFLNHYYKQLKVILASCNIDIEDVMTEKQFLESADEQRLWALIICACLMPQFWIDEDLTTEIFTDTAQFEEIMSRDKGAFIKKLMQVNPDYKEKVMEIFDEIVKKYCLHDTE